MFIRNLKRRHSLLRTPIAHNGPNLLSIHIAGHQFGTGQVGPAFSPRRVAPMAKSAALLKQRCSLLDQLRWIFRSSRRFLFGFAACLRTAGRLLRRGLRDRESQHTDSEQHSHNRRRTNQVRPTRLQPQNRSHLCSCPCGRACDAVLPSVMPSTHLIASKYILRISGSLHDSCVCPSVE